MTPVEDLRRLRPRNQAPVATAAETKLAKKVSNTQAALMAVAAE